MKVYVIYPKKILLKDQAEWDKYLYQITPEWESWSYYALDNHLVLVIAEIYGALNVHAAFENETTAEYEEVTTLELLKGLALKKLIMRK